MDLALIEKLMAMLAQSDLEELDVTEGGMRIRLAKQRMPASNGTPPIRPPIAIDPVAAPDANPARRQIVSGMAGTFYHSPSPGAAPFVHAGSPVREGQQLAIVEAMKMLNPIEADCDGTIRLVLIEDGDSVEPGTVLFEIDTP